MQWISEKGHLLNTSLCISTTNTTDVIKSRQTPLAWKLVAGDKTWGPIQLGDGL